MRILFILQHLWITKIKTIYSHANHSGPFGTIFVIYTGMMMHTKSVQILPFSFCFLYSKQAELFPQLFIVEIQLYFPPGSVLTWLTVRIYQYLCNCRRHGSLSKNKRQQSMRTVGHLLLAVRV